MFALAHFYGGGLPFSYMKESLTMIEIDEAVKFMNEEKKAEAKRNGA